MEIERRFLIRDIDKVNELIKEYAETKKVIKQDYIYSDIYTAIRKRLIIKNDVPKYIYTVKTGRRELAVNEFESEISKEDYDKLKIDPSRIRIEKDRYLIPYRDNLKIELDVFHGAYEGVVFAEIEFESVEQAMAEKFPEWFGPEIGKYVSNDKMSKKLIDVEKVISGK